MTFRRMAAVLTAMAATAGAWAQDEEKPRRDTRLYIGPQIGVFLPTAGLTRDRFGSDWTNVGFGLGPVEPPRERGVLNLDFTFLTSRSKVFSSGGQSLRSRALVIPVGVEYRRGIGADGAPGPRPYVGASLGGVVANLESRIDGISSTWRGAVAGSIFTGVVFSRHGYLEAHYYVMDRILGFDFSGLNLAAGYRF